MIYATLSVLIARSKADDCPIRGARGNTDDYFVLAAEMASSIIWWIHLAVQPIYRSGSDYEDIDRVFNLAYSSLILIIRNFTASAPLRRHGLISRRKPMSCYVNRLIPGNSKINSPPYSKQLLVKTIIQKANMRRVFSHLRRSTSIRATRQGSRP